MRRTSSQDYAPKFISDDQGKGFIATGTSVDKLPPEANSYLELIAPAKLTEVSCLPLLLIMPTTTGYCLMSFINIIFR